MKIISYHRCLIMLVRGQGCSRTGLTLLGLLLTAFVLIVSTPAVHAGPPVNHQAPLLYVRFLVPEDGHVTFYPVPGHTREFPAPVVVGLRPGYIYRVKLSGLPVRPELNLYPTLEVRGTLHLPQVIPSADHPAPIVLTREDIERIHAGVLVTKVVFLENPETAIAQATRSDNPIEMTVQPGESPWEEALLRGRPLLIVRIGGRQVSEEELNAQSVPGTILLPRQRGLLPPARPPCIPWACVPVVDPLWGLKHPDEECLHDGGDCHIPVGFDRNGQIGGLDPTDTVASYRDSRGRRGISISNRVCVCVPRFMVMRGDLRAVGFDVAYNPQATETVQAQLQVENRVPIHETNQRESLEGLRMRQRLSGNINSNGPQQVGFLSFLRAYDMSIGPAEAIGEQQWRMLTGEIKTKLYDQMHFVQQLLQIEGVRAVEQMQLGPRAVGTVMGTKVVAQVQEVRDLTSNPCEPPREPEQPLYLYKWADRRSAQVGDTVTFYIKYTNHGGQPIDNVAISDSLTGRLEYIDGTAKSDRDAVFTRRPNEAGSLILQWEVAGRLLPGQSGVVSFEGKIR